MLARHEGQIVFVAGAIPGERVRVRIDRVQQATRVWKRRRRPRPEPRSKSGRCRLGVRWIALCAHRVRAAAPAEVGSDRRRICAHRQDAARRAGRRACVQGRGLSHARPASRARWEVRIFPRRHARALRRGADATAAARLHRCAAAARGRPAADVAVTSCELSENAAATERAVLLELAPSADAPDHVDPIDGISDCCSSIINRGI